MSMFRENMRGYHADESRFSVHIYICIILFLAVSFVTPHAAGAITTVLQNEKFSKGDGYQINNYALEMTDTLVMGTTKMAFFRLYSVLETGETEEITGNSGNPMGIELNSSYIFNVPDGKIEVTLIDVGANVYIKLGTDFDVKYGKYLYGGHNRAGYSGKPMILLTKTVDKTSVRKGDTIQVTISAANLGKGAAASIVLQDMQVQDNSLVFNRWIYPAGGVIVGEYALDPEKSAPLQIYELKVSEDAAPGNHTLGQAKVTYRSKSVVETVTYTNFSSIPEIFVKGEAGAVLQITLALDTLAIPQGNTAKVTINVENTGKLKAESVSIESILPDGLVYAGSPDESISVVKGNPIKKFTSALDPLDKREFTYSVKASKIGEYKIVLNTSHREGAGVSFAPEQSSDTIYVGENTAINPADYLIYIVPLAIVIGIGGWIYWRHNQFKY
ncbi:MAG TPA: DUF11 domain-containing protein [Candidatus Methanoperedenaceae archaeon]|nr:DUF11 domain-containing protein [Candidatus Methanoperedenaceae archaeon]